MKLINNNRKHSDSTFKNIKKETAVFKTARGEYLVKNTTSNNKSEILFRSFDKKLVEEFFINLFPPK